MNTTRTTATSPPTRRLLRYGTCLAFALGALTVGARLAGPKPALGASPAPLGDDRDWQIAFQARTLLLEEPVLASLNLGVSVRDRVATLWGAVPSVADARRAQTIVRGIPGVASIRNEMNIDAACKEDLPSAVPSAKPAARGEERKHLTPAPQSFPQWLPSKETRPAKRKDMTPPRKGVTDTGPKPTSKELPARPAQPSSLMPEELRKKVTEERSASLRRQDPPEQVLPAIAIPTAPSRRSSMPATRVQRTLVGKPAPGTEEAIKDLMRLNQEFDGIRVKVHGKLVYIFRKPASAADSVFRLAEAVSEIPGVDRVIVKEEDVAGGNPR
jgi:hypothetical protein